MKKRPPQETPETPKSDKLEIPAAPEIPDTTQNPESPMSSPEADPIEPAAEAAVELAADAAAAAPAADTTIADAPVTEGAPAEPSVPTPANDDAVLRRALEALLFITDRPLSAAELGKLVGVRDQDKIIGTVEELRRDLEAKDAGYRLIAVAEGWQMSTRPELAPYVRKLFADRATMRLSTAAQETLSIISYKQPLTRAEIEEIRGVEVIAALETLLEKGLTKVVGRKETVGRPLMYGTTSEFLRHFGLRSLEDLPPIDSFTPADDVSAAVAPADAAAAPEPAIIAAVETSSEPVAPAEEAPAAETPAEPPVDESAADEPGEGSVWPK
jgi:segregation and condensation protein B